MIALFIIAFALLAATAYALYRRQHTSTDYPAQLDTGAVSPRSLFEHRETDKESKLLLAAQASKEAAESNAALLKRAAEGDLTTLAEAHRAKDSALYEGVMVCLLEWAAASETRLRSLATFIGNDENLRGNSKLATAYMKLWQQQPDRQNTAQMLHLAALSDDAGAFERAIEIACDFLQKGRLHRISSEELSTLIEGEFWVLSSAARGTGAGFVLKQRMTALLKELATNRKTESPNVEI